MTATFSHLDAGTPDDVWRTEPRIGRLPEVDTDADELIVVAAHPDDETLGAAGLIRRFHRAGRPVTVVVATDGERSHPQSHTHTPGRLAKMRRAEVREAVGALAPGSVIRFLGLPDGGLRECRAHLTEQLDAVLGGALDGGHDGEAPAAERRRRILVVAPWSGDGHRDHRVAAEVVARVCARRGLRHLGYPIWAWHWGSPDDIPWESAAALALTDDELGVKRLAVAHHRSQIAPLSPEPGDERVLHAQMRAHFERSVEVFVQEQARGSASLSAEWFAEFYRRNGADPWGFETRWYEKRKRGILMSALPNERLGSVLEIGCSTGLVTRQLVARADHVVAIEPVAAALGAAESRLVDDPRVTFVHGGVPAAWPAGRFDTVVVSEVLYYLSREDLARTIELIEAALAPDGCLIACHWRHPVAEYPLTGDDVHAALRSSDVWESIAHHEELDFVLDVFAPIPAASVAEREGLA